MKRQNIVLIVVVAIISGVISFVVANFIFGGQKTYNLTSPIINPITSNFTLPSSQYFNQQSIDPTQKITIGTSNNTSPF